jgi:hypothetical protein
MLYYTYTETNGAEMKNINSVFELVDTINEMVEDYVSGMRKVNATKLGLDVRCGDAFVDEDYIVCYASNRFDYYGGFEYVRSDCVQVIGDYKFYSADDSRIADAIECLMEFDGECESEEA